MTIRAESLFEEIMADPAAWVTNAAATGYTESEIIDFKQHRNDKDSRQLWAKALSGFSNTGGGIVFWGVDARKKEQPGKRWLDVVTGPAPVADPKAFAQYLREQARTITSDPVQGVRIEPVLLPDGTGYVICLIPDGNHKPYKDEVEKKYWQRIQDSFTDISHSMLRAMFYPASSVTFRLYTFWDSFGRFSLIAVNRSQRTAENVYIRVMYNAAHTRRVDFSIKTMSGNPTSGHQQDTHPESVLQSLMLHPRQSHSLGQFDVPMNTKGSATQIHASIEVIIYCKDHDPQHFLAELPQGYTGPFTENNGFTIVELPLHNMQP